MQLCIRRLACLALLAAALAVTAAAPNKVVKCCTEASIANITAPILGYRVQKRAIPCIAAVIFETTEGEVCSHWKQDWVIEKVKELEQLRRAAKSSTPAPTTSSS